MTPATDLYALGLVLYELFTGDRLQAGGDVQAIRSAQFTQVQPMTTGASKDRLVPVVRRVIERCLDLDPKRRPQSAVVVAAALPVGDPLAEALAAGEPNLAALRPAPLRFWYRGHSDVLIAWSLRSIDNTARPDVDAPALTEPGMTYLELDSQGRLEKFHAIAPNWTAADAPSATPDWPELFREAGLDFGFVRVAPSLPLGRACSRESRCSTSF